MVPDNPPHPANDKDNEEAMNNGNDNNTFAPLTVNNDDDNDIKST